MTDLPPPLPPQHPPKKRSGCAGRLLLLLLLASLAANALLLLGLAGSKVDGGRVFSGHTPTFGETILESGSGSDKVALITLSGVISFGAPEGSGDGMVDEFKAALKQALRDSDVKAILVEIDSPGGEVTASDALYDALKRARTEKPVVVYMKSVAASGGYYAACGGTWIIAADTTITGSIGVIWQTLKYKDLLGKIGVEVLTFKSGKFKDLLNGSRDVAPEEIAYVQAMVMQTYDRFVGVVATERKIPAETLKAGLADGRILSGRDALQNGLIHAVGYVENAYAKARELGGAPNAAIVRYEPKFNLARALGFLGQSRAATLKLDLGTPSLSLDPGKLYLLPESFAR